MIPKPPSFSLAPFPWNQKDKNSLPPSLESRLLTSNALTVIIEPPFSFSADSTLTAYAYRNTPRD